MQSPSDVYDVIVIGGGVVGCAIVYQLSLCGYRCLLAEKEDVILSGASAGNSGMVHSGFDAAPGTESECLQANSELEALCTDFHVPYRKIGGIMIAKNEEELLALDRVMKSSQLNGIHNLKKLTKEDVLLMEPNLNGILVYGGLLIPEEAVIDSWLLPVSLVHQAKKYGAKVQLGCEIVSGKQMSNQIWMLNSSLGALKASVVVNAAGLHGDLVEEICQPTAFNIQPRKGQFVVYEQEAARLIRHIILPVPSEKSKGILIYPSVYGNLVVGPTADECTERSNPILLESVTKMLIEYGQQMIPPLARYKTVKTYAGIRPATQNKDYYISCNTNRRWVTVGGIRSTGVTCCLPIAKRVCTMIKDQLKLALDEKDLESDEPRIEQRPWNKWSADGNSIVMDGVEYSITHPLTRLGYNSNPHSKL